MIVLKENLYEGTSIKQLLPKGWWLNDFSPTENLIEIEDRNDGDRFWVEPKELFRRNIKIGTEVFIYIGKQLVQPAEIEKFDACIFHNRCYLLAVLKQKEKEPVPFNREIHL